MLKLGFVAGAAGYHAMQFATRFNAINEGNKALIPSAENRRWRHL